MTLSEKAGDAAGNTKRILSLDGGGVRGIISLAFLERLESILAKRSADPEAFRLSQYFDLVGGTSTGAIIAAAIALGMKVSEVKEIYLSLSKDVFRQSWFRILGLQAKFSALPLMKVFDRHIGERTLDSSDLECYLAIVAKRVDTGSVWVISNNPNAKYWHDPEDGSYIGNRHYPIKNIVRASAAAPIYFDPEPIEIIAGEAPGVFVDGAISPHNNPSLQLLMLANIPAYGFSWPLGKDNVLLVSVGTGEIQHTLDARRLMRFSAAGKAARAISGMVDDGQKLVLMLMYWMSESGGRWPLNSEIGDLAGATIDHGALLSFLRYDIKLTQGWLGDELGERVSHADIKALSSLDNPQAMELAYRLAANAAQRQVSEADLPARFNRPQSA